MSTGLRPEVRNVLDELDELGIPSFSDLSVSGARKMHAEVLGSDEGEEPVAGVTDYVIDGPEGDLSVRVYTPDRDGPLPVLVFAHGGGWMLGDLESHDLECRMLANAADCLVISVEYRLSPEHPFPAPVREVHAAVQWAHECAGVIGGDPERIAVGGDSSGGNIAAAVALADRDLGDGVLEHQLLVYPATNHSFDTDSYRENGDGYFLTRADMEFFWSHYLPNEMAGEHPYASPLRARDLSGLPSATVLTAEFDPLRDDGIAYADRLETDGVPVDHLAYDGVIHGFWHMQTQLESANRAMDDLAESLRAAFAE